jgi:general secretion pathway protein K
MLRRERPVFILTPNFRQRGTVIIVTLWTITLLTILVTVLASQVRLAARATQYQQDDLGNWAAVTAALNQAEMEIVLDLMDPPLLNPEQQAEGAMNPHYSRYRGQEMTLTYPQSEDVVVRMWDHGGKINLAELSRQKLRALLEFKLGQDADPGRIDQLMAAWADWLDLNAQAGINGAESDYYSDLEPPYQARNGRLETVDEILQIRGFDEVFGDIDLEAAFTVYGENDLINLNLATVEAMRLLPGLNEELIEQIVAWRETHEFYGNGDVAQLMPAEAMGELRGWLNSRRVTSHFTIMAYRRQRPDNAGADGDEVPLPGDVIVDPHDAATTGYAEIVEIASFTNTPRVLKINPYQSLPLRMIVVPEDGLPQ